MRSNVNSLKNEETKITKKNRKMKNCGFDKRGVSKLHFRFYF